MEVFDLPTRPVHSTWLHSLSSSILPECVQLDYLLILDQEVQPMIRYIIISIISGILFGVMDGVININPLAKRLYEVYKPIARTSINPLKGIVIDLAYGFIMAIAFLLLYTSLPGETGFLKGICFAVLVWFFRVVMNNASQWVMFKVPVKTLLYSAITGLGEMLILGMFYGLTLKPV